MQVKRMEEIEISQIVEIENELFSRPWKEEDFKNALSEKQYIYLVAKQGEIVAGYCGLQHIVDEGHIYNVAVANEFQRRGVASLLMKELIKIGLESGIRGFHLEVRAGNIPAIQLYKRLGFLEVGRRKDFYDKPKEDGINMSFFLD